MKTRMSAKEIRTRLQEFLNEDTLKMREKAQEHLKILDILEKKPAADLEVQKFKSPIKTPTKQVTCVLKGSVKDRLRRYAFLNGYAINQVMADAIECYLNDKDTSTKG